MLEEQLPDAVDGRRIGDAHHEPEREHESQ